MFQDPTFWVAVSLFILVASIWRWARPQIEILLKNLDDQSKKIQENIIQAQSVYEKTLKMHKDAKAAVEDAKVQAREILEHTKIEIAHSNKDAEEKLKKLSESYDAKITSRLERGRSQAIQDLHSQVTQLVLKASHQVVDQIIKDPKNIQKIQDTSMDEINKLGLS
jgi:F-type H+-transporting ATPase subunit b